MKIATNRQDAWFFGGFFFNKNQKLVVYLNES